MNFVKTFTTRALMAAILAAASYAAYASSADDEPRSVSVTVRYDDLNLSAPAGVLALKRRISRAAAQVCADQDASDPLGKIRSQGCVRRATDNALAQVKWPQK